jgi:O-succinylbenzoic acid--CoA ligase
MRTENWLARSAATAPDRIALVAAGETLTFAQLDEQAASAARRLAALGAGPGERVGLVLGLSRDHVTLIHALARLGAVAMPLDPLLPEAELERRLESARAGLVIRDPAAVWEQADAGVLPAANIDLDAPCSVIFSSGTGGVAKPVELTYGNHLWSALGSAARIGVDGSDRWLCCLPLHHVGGLAIVLRSVVYGTAVLLEPFDPARVASLVHDQQATLASLVATTLERLLDAGAELHRLRCVLLGGGPAAASLIERALESGVPLAPTYGLTEAASQVTTLVPGLAWARPGSAGTPLVPTEVKIDGGVICVRGPTVAPAAAGEDGWLRTGDLGRIEQGHLYVTGRADDVIVTGGENVLPERVEQALLEHPAVADAGAFGRDDPRWQRAVVAAVVLHDGQRASKEELREFCRARLAAFEVPKEIRIQSALPRDPQGKLRRHELAGE